MAPVRLRVTARQRRSFVTSLFGFTFFASVATVFASTILPCPARKDRVRWAESNAERDSNLSKVEVVKRPRRWIEETKTSSVMSFSFECAQRVSSACPLPQVVFQAQQTPRRRPIRAFPLRVDKIEQCHTSPRTHIPGLALSLAHSPASCASCSQGMQRPRN
ncbi:hypothetical protein K439DRAFT_15545 [Ramaria rubella]|nr:hypothetical protein K439DRAFT_15545 [Ramaria rubella]